MALVGRERTIAATSVVLRLATPVPGVWGQSCELEGQTHGDAPEVQVRQGHVGILVVDVKHHGHLTIGQRAHLEHAAAHSVLTRIGPDRAVEPLD